MASIEIHCPTCKSVGTIDVSEKTMENVERGLLAINIAPNIICEHTFVVYIDKNMEVRNYFTADFQLELPELKETSSKLKSKSKYIIPDEETFDIDLIKLNLSPNVFSFILKSIFSKQKIILISEKTFLWDHLQKFFEYITQNNFNVDIQFLTQEEFNKTKQELVRDYMVFNEYKIVNNLDNRIDPDKIKIEKQIINRFLSERRLSYSYLLLRNDINMAYDLSKKAMKIVEQHNKKNQIGKKALIDKIKKEFDFKISYDYLEFLLEIMKNYFQFDTSGISSYFIPNLGI
ncbi:MAG: hypothetical protein GF364_10110 [Candidatus Lokiarchaeota archaeon]|nr:hypothetical protein [Candidatus Lokiarchaeota archaeon]